MKSIVAVLPETKEIISDIVEDCEQNGSDPGIWICKCLCLDPYKEGYEFIEFQRETILPTGIIDRRIWIGDYKWN